MKLVLKQPKDKPPFIGIQFASDYIASKTNNDLVAILGKEGCHLILEPSDKYYLDLRLVNTDKIIDRAYRKVEYNELKLKTWLLQNKQAIQFNFAHVVLGPDKHIVVKAASFNKNFVIRINSIEIRSEI